MIIGLRPSPDRLALDPWPVCLGLAGCQASPVSHDPHDSSRGRPPSSLEIPRFIRGNNVSLEAMHDELLGLDLQHSVPAVDVPVIFFLGRYDHHVDATIAARYFDSLLAPSKQLVWFENSAHNIPFEEPELFTGSVVTALRSIDFR